MLLSIGVALLLRAGQLDISLGANVILSSVVGGEVMGAVKNPGLGIFLGTIACILTGAAGGLFNAAVVIVLRVNSFIATLASLGIMTGIAYVITGGYNVSTVPFSLQTDFGIGRLFGVIPYPALIALAVALVAGWFLYQTRFGLHTLALGSSREAAIRAGVKVRKKLVSYSSSQACAQGSPASSIWPATPRLTSAVIKPMRSQRLPAPLSVAPTYLVGRCPSAAPCSAHC